MKRTNLCPLLLSLIVLLVCTAVPAKAQTDAEDLNERWEEAWAEQDMDAVRSQFAEDVVVVFNGEEMLRGKETVMQEWVSTHLPAIRSLETEVIASQTADRLAYLSGRYSLEGETPSGPFIEIGTYVAVWEKNSDGNWKVKLFQFGPIQTESGQSASQSTSGDAREAIEEIYAELTQAMEEGKAARIANRFYMEDAILFPPNMPPAEGRAAIEQVFAGMIGAGIVVVPEPVEVEAYGDTAYERGMATVMRDGQVIAQQPYMVIWKQVNGEWKMYRDFVKSGSGQTSPEQQ